MVSYPVLSLEQQSDLPELTAPADRLPQLFEDSTHQLWRCDTVDGPMILKICNQNTVEHSSFWQAMNALFNSDFPAALAHIDETHHLINQLSPFVIPEFISAEASSFVLVRMLVGEDVSADIVSNEMVQLLAQHLVQLHQHTSSHWGPIYRATFSDQQWRQRLQTTLELLAKNVSLEDKLLHQALVQASQLSVDTFSPVMVDLRWDQMLHQHGHLSAIVDMDAFVIAPRELELVLLEYQLTQQQADVLVEHYQKTMPFPDLSTCRTCYRLLLFLMNSLGETDIKKWMKAPLRY